MEYIYCYSDNNQATIGIDTRKRLLVVKNIINGEEKLKHITTVLGSLVINDTSRAEAIIHLVEGQYVNGISAPQVPAVTKMEYCKYCDGHYADLFHHIEIRHPAVRLTHGFKGTSGTMLGS
jgi:hypothetical protein